MYYCVRFGHDDDVGDGDCDRSVVCVLVIVVVVVVVIMPMKNKVVENWTSSPLSSRLPQVLPHAVWL